MQIVLLGGAARFQGTKSIRFVFVIAGMRAFGANHEILLDVVVVCGHPRNKQTRVGARNDAMDVEPATVNTSGKVGIGLGARMIAVIVTRFLVCVFFAGLRIVFRTILIIVGDGVQQRVLL